MCLRKPHPRALEVPPPTDRAFDASTMVGWVGQPGWTHDYKGKASSLRSNGRACLYLHPSEECSGQLVLLLRDLKIHVVRAVKLCLDPSACSAMLAGTVYHRPRGAARVPDADLYTEKLRALLAPSRWFTTSHLAGCPCMLPPSSHNSARTVTSRWYPLSRISHLSRTGVPQFHPPPGCSGGR